MDSALKVLIVVPCYNELENIETLYHEIREKTTYDVIIVNDCSTDGCKELLQSKNIPFLDLPMNLGIGGAVQTGYIYALRNNYDVAVQVDGDGQHDPSWIEAIVKPIDLAEADLVIGSRFIDNEGFQSSTLRRVGIQFFKMLIYCLSGKRITDATSGFRAINKKTLKLFTSYYAKDFPEPESNMLALRNKLRVVEIPVSMRERQGGVSSISPLKSIYYMFKVSIGILISTIKPRIDFDKGD